MSETQNDKKPLTLDLFIEYNSTDRLLTTIHSIEDLNILSSVNVFPNVHVLVKIDNPLELINIRHSLEWTGVAVDIIGYFEPSHQTLSKKCNAKYVAFMQDGDDYDAEFFNELSDTVYTENRPILFAKNDKVVCASRFMYDSFCLEENPMQEIYESCLYSKPNLVLDLGDTSSE